VPVNKNWDRVVDFGSCAEKCDERMKDRKKQHAKIRVEVGRTEWYIWEDEDAIMERTGRYTREEQDATHLTGTTG
jgi:hypothetical protein